MKQINGPSWFLFLNGQSVIPFGKGTTGNHDCYFLYETCLKYKPKKILEIPNVKFIHPSVDPKKIYPHCSLVITVTGTAALESLYYKKPSIIFSSTNFSNLSSVKKIDNIEQLPTTISASLKEKVDSDEVSNFYSFVEQNSFDFDISNLTYKSRRPTISFECGIA